jgi:hypothetical protein
MLSITIVTLTRTQNHGYSVQLCMTVLDHDHWFLMICGTRTKFGSAAAHPTITHNITA